MTTRTVHTNAIDGGRPTAAAGTAAAEEDDAWVLCTDCHTPIYGKRLARNLYVCPEGRAHQRLTARQRLEQLADAGRFEALPLSTDGSDPLGFVDTMPYPDRPAGARARTGMDEGSAVGELITAMERALAECTPLVLVTASGGARMQEGALSLVQMAETGAALGQLDEAGVLTVSLITDPAFGGVAASLATLTDVDRCDPRRAGGTPRIGRAEGDRADHPAASARRVPDREFLLRRGFVDKTVPRSRLRAELGPLLRAGSGGRLREEVPDGGAGSRETGAGTPQTGARQRKDGAALREAGARESEPSALVREPGALRTP
ncbi:carboxyl transferase domain-containing protein [Streptomyces luteolus]|uniref:carboxyl transferase domain-containing protein n=1 Tax=Streptomyces luteolus TaxID=3043615 RepID=UPI0032B72B83